jgi:putative transcriptional regulator
MKTKAKAKRPTPEERILQGLHEALAHARGEHVEGMVTHAPRTVDVAAVRKRQGLTQDAFAKRYGFTVAAVRDWEQGRRQPEAAARVLLTVIDKEPEAVKRALAG